MARRPESEAILNREQLAEFTRRLQMLSDDGVEEIYETAYKDCRYDRNKLPPAAAIQQLVACWRVLRKFRAMSSQGRQHSESSKPDPAKFRRERA